MSRPRTPKTHDEETPLLRDERSEDAPKPMSPIPWGQFSILLLLQLSEPLTHYVIYPFAPQFVRDVGITHGDETKVGYYVGVLQSLFFATQALTVLQWSRVSDHIGRKKVIMNGLIGISLSMYSFGLSKTFWGAVISRALNGALNGNIGVLKSQLGALFDETNMAHAYTYMPMVWSTGTTLGPLIGGGLSWPTKRFPNVFGHSKFLAEYPYFLPCAVPATFAALAWIMSYFFLEETVKQPVSLLVFLRLRKAPGNLVLQNVVEGQDPSVTEDPQPESSASTQVNSRAASVAKDAPNDDGEPLPLRALLVKDVIVAGGNYALLSLADIAFRAIQPLFYSTPREFGGLGLDPLEIGRILAMYGILNGIFQTIMFARINARFGAKNTFMMGTIATTFMFAGFPVLTLIADARGAVDGWVYAGIAVQLSASMLTSISYGCIFIFITAASPNRASLGGTNGLCQMLVSWMRAFGPGLANSLYSLSLRERTWTVYYVLEALSVVVITGACFLPRNPWREGKRKQAPTAGTLCGQ